MIVSMGTAVKESIVMIVSSMMKRVWNDMSQTIIFTLEEDDNFEWVEWNIVEDED